MKMEEVMKVKRPEGVLKGAPSSPTGQQEPPSVS